MHTKRLDKNLKDTYTFTTIFNECFTQTYGF